MLCTGQPLCLCRQNVACFCQLWTSAHAVEPHQPAKLLGFYLLALERSCCRYLCSCHAVHTCGVPQGEQLPRPAAAGLGPGSMCPTARLCSAFTTSTDLLQGCEMTPLTTPWPCDSASAWQRSGRRTMHLCCCLKCRTSLMGRWVAHACKSTNKTAGRPELYASFWHDKGGCCRPVLPLAYLNGPCLLPTALE